MVMPLPERPEGNREQYDQSATLGKDALSRVPQDDLTSVLENLTEVYSRGKGRTARDPNETAHQVASGGWGPGAC